MSAKFPTNERKDYEIPCELLPVSDFDLSEALTPEQRAKIPVGGFVRDEVVHAEVAIDFSPTALSEQQPTQLDIPSPADEIGMNGDEEGAELMPVHELPEVLFEGELEPAQLTYGATSPDIRPRVAIGRPQFWRAEDTLKDEIGKPFTRPKGDYYFWLLQIPCTIYPVEAATSGGERWEITEAQLEFFMQPLDEAAGDNGTTAFLLHPNREVTETRSSVSFGLAGPSCETPDGTKLTAVEFNTALEYRKVFAVIESFGVGTPAPTWVFKAHPNRPLQGDQIVYAVVAVARRANGLRAQVHFTVKVEQKTTGLWSWLGMARAAQHEISQDKLKFRIARQTK